MDTVSVKRRSEIMSRIRSRDTIPELFVRSLTHRLGYRFRLQGINLLGRPDLVFASRQKVIFVHGCFWHGHQGCDRARIPQSHREYWLGKIERNRKRDRAVGRLLLRRDWERLVVWECEIRRPEALAGRIIQFLDKEV